MECFTTTFLCLTSYFISSYIYTFIAQRKVPSQDETTPINQSWNSNFGRGLHRYSSGYNNGERYSKFTIIIFTYIFSELCSPVLIKSNVMHRYSLYDKRYEDVGLPLDPHLRIFMASNGNGKFIFIWSM